MKRILKAAFAAFSAAVLFTNICGTSVFASYLTDTENADEYICINKDEIPYYSSNYDVGARDNLKLVFDIPTDKLDNALFVEGLDNMCYFKLEIHNAKWRNVLLKRTNETDIDYVTEGAKDNDDKYFWDIRMNNEVRPITSINEVSYNEKYFETVQYAAAYFISDGRSLEETGGILDGEYPLLFRTTGGGDVTIDISVYTGEDMYDLSKFREDDYEYIGTVTVAGGGDRNKRSTVKTQSTAKPAETTEQTTEAATQAPEAKPAERIQGNAEAKTIAEVPIGKPYYIINGAGFETDSPAFISDGYTMLPLRAMAGVTGIGDDAVAYEPGSKTAIISYEGSVIRVSAGENTMYINDMPAVLDAPAVIENGRMYLPMRAVAEALGFDDIEFDTVTKTVTIKL